MYWITEKVKFMHNTESYETILPEDYPSFVELVNQLFKINLSSNLSLYYQIRGKEKMFISDQKNFNKIQDTGLRLIVIFVVIEPNPSFPFLNPPNSDLKAQYFISDEYFQKSEPKSQENNESVLTSVYKVRDLDEKTVVYDEWAFHGDTNNKGMALSAVYTSALQMDNLENQNHIKTYSFPSIGSIFGDIGFAKKRNQSITEMNFPINDYDDNDDDEKRKKDMLGSFKPRKEPRIIEFSDTMNKLKEGVKDKQELLKNALKQKSSLIKDNIKTWLK